MIKAVGLAFMFHINLFPLFIGIACRHLSTDGERYHFSIFALVGTGIDAIATGSTQ